VFQFGKRYYIELSEKHKLYAGYGPLYARAVRNVIAFCTRGMGHRTTFAKMRTQDSPLSCVQGSIATARRSYTRLYAGH
jgi:hypothetical protein